MVNTLAPGRLDDRHAAVLRDLPPVGLRVRRRVPADGVGQHAAAQPRRRHVRGRDVADRREPARLVLGRVVRRLRQRRLAGHLRGQRLGLQRPRHRDRARVPEQRRQRAAGVQDRHLLRSEALRQPLLARLGAQPAPAQQRRRHVSRDRPRRRHRPAAQQPRRRRGRLLEPRRPRHRGRGLDRPPRAAAERASSRPRTGSAVELVGHASRTATRSARASRSASAGTRQMREVVLGDGYGSQNTLRQHFGLGDATAGGRTARAVAAIRRRCRRFTDVAVDRIVADHRRRGRGWSRSATTEPAIAPVPALPG